MKAAIVEIRDGLAAVLSDDGRISKIKNKNYVIGQVIEMKAQAANNTKKFAAWAAAAAAVICISGTGVWAYASPYSYVSLDVNPSVEYTLNRFDRVLSVRAVNDDGTEIIEELGLKNLSNRSIEDAMAATVQKISDDGFFEGDLTGGVVITTSGKDLKRAGQLAEELKTRVEEAVPDKNVNIEAEAVGKERVEQARELGVTPGKLNLVEKLQASSSNPESVKLEDWLNKPVKEIMQEIKDNRKAEQEAQKPEKPKDNEGKKPQTESSSPEADSSSETESPDKTAEKAESKVDKIEDKLESRLENDNGNTEKITEQAEDKASKTEEKAESKAEKEKAKESAAESRAAEQQEKKEEHDTKEKTANSSSEKKNDNAGKKS